MNDVRLGRLGVVAFSVFILVCGGLALVWSAFSLSFPPLHWYSYGPIVFTAILFPYLVLALALLALGRPLGRELATTGVFALHGVFFAFVFYLYFLNIQWRAMAETSYWTTTFLDLGFVAAISVVGWAAAVGRLLRASWAYGLALAMSVLMIMTITGAAAGAIAIYALATSPRPAPAPIPVSPAP